MGSASYDCASAILLCAEDNRSILGLDEEDGGGLLPGRRRRRSSAAAGGAPAGFHVQTEECLAMLVLRERHHLPREDYATRLQTGALDLSLRRDAIDWICKVCSSSSSSSSSSSFPILFVVVIVVFFLLFLFSFFCVRWAFPETHLDLMV